MIIGFFKLILELCDADHSIKNRLCDVGHKKKDRRDNISKFVFDFVFFHVLMNDIYCVLFMSSSITRRRNQL